MSQSRRGADYKKLEDAQVGRVRSGGGRPIVTVGYAPGGDALAARPLSGDQKFAFLKDPPDVEGPHRLGQPVQTFGGAVIQGNIPGPAPFATGNPGFDLLAFPPRANSLDATDVGDAPGIDVRGVRNVLVFIEYFPVDPLPSPSGAELIILPEARLRRPPDADQIAAAPAGRDFFPVPIISPTVVPGGTFGQTYAVQQTFAAEFRFTGTGWDSITDGPLVQTRSFNVETYDEIRFLVGDRLSAASGLNFFYARER